MFGIVVWLMSSFAGDVEFMQTVYALCGCLLFSMFIVYDTQLIVGGRHKKHQFGVDEYVFAALNLTWTSSTFSCSSCRWCREDGGRE